MQLELTVNETDRKCQPFLRWAGGKTWFVKHLSTQVPKTFNNYHEPFLGGGSIFFNIICKKQNFLSDLNPDLIDTYIQVRDNVEKVICQLKKFKNTEEEYYRIRNQNLRAGYSKAARFIYLNMTSFNGIYRVNRKGQYNVPFGHRLTIDFVQENILRQASKKLKASNLKSLDFEEAFQNVKSGDFVFIDPPYTVAHENNGFIAYNQKLFSLDDQLRLANSLERLNSIGAFYLITNAYHTKIKDIYTGLGNFIHLSRKSLIGGKGAKREDIKEYIIKNF